MTHIVHVIPRREIRRRQLAAVLSQLQQFEQRLAVIEKRHRHRRQLDRALTLVSHQFRQMSAGTTLAAIKPKKQGSV